MSGGEVASEMMGMWGGGVYHAGAEHGGGEGGLCAEAELDTLILASRGRF